MPESAPFSTQCLTAMVGLAWGWLLLGVWESRRGQRRGALEAAVLAAVSLTLCAGVHSAWRTPWLALLLLALLPLTLLPLAVLAGGARLRRGMWASWRMHLLLAAIAAGGALLTWFNGELLGLPANWYAPWDGPVEGPYVPPIRHRGVVSGLWRLVALLLPVGSEGILLTHLLLGALLTVLLPLLLLRRDEDENIRVLVVLWALLLAADPLLWRMWYSDGLMVWALLLWAATGFALRAAQRRATLHTDLAVLAGSALVGLTRLEFLTAPLALPLLLGGRLRARTHAAVALGVLCAWGATPGHDKLERLGFSWQRLGVWAWEVYAQSPQPSPFPGWMMPLVLLGGVLALLRREWWHLGWLAMPYAVSLPRLFSPLYVPSFARSVVSARYDVPVLLLWHLLLAAAVWRFGRELGRGLAWLGASVRLSTGLGYGMAGGALLAALYLAPAELQPARQLLTFQQEYRFWREARHLLPQGARVAVVWQKGAGNDFDLSLSVPHLLCVYDRPDLEWRSYNLERLHLPIERPYFAWETALVQVPPDDFAALGQHGQAEALRELRGRWERLVDAQATLVLERSYQAQTLHPEILREGRLTLRLYRVE